MIDFFKKYWRIILIALVDLQLVAGFIICRPLSGFMLTLESECAWSIINMKCATCGGTHFVNDITSFRFIDAFFDHQYFFFLTLYLFVAVIFLHMLLIFRNSFARKALKYMFSLYFAIIAVATLVGFTFFRNLAPIIEITPQIIESMPPK